MFQGFFCASEADFNDFYREVQASICEEKTRIFEMHLKRPRHWPHYDVNSSSPDIGACSTGNKLV